MARPQRFHVPSLTYHVMARGNGRMAIFRDDEDHRRFLGLLDLVVRTCALRCWAYCLMPNHYHLVVQTTDDNLSRAMRQLNGIYAQWWNRRHERVGHVTQGRFKAQVIQEERYLLAVCRYVLLNPVRAGLVDDPAAWRWSSCAATLGLAEAPALLSPHLLLDACSAGNPERQRAAVRRLLESGDALAVGQAIRDDWRVIGDDAFSAALYAREPAPCPEVPAKERGMGRLEVRRQLLTPTGGALTVRVATLLAAGHDPGLVGRVLGLPVREVQRLARYGRRWQHLHASREVT